MLCDSYSIYLYCLNILLILYILCHQVSRWTRLFLHFPQVLWVDRDILHIFLYLSGYVVIVSGNFHWGFLSAHLIRRTVILMQKYVFISIEPEVTTGWYLFTCKNNWYNGRFYIFKLTLGMKDVKRINGHGNKYRHHNCAKCKKIWHGFFHGLANIIRQHHYISVK